MTNAKQELLEILKDKSPIKCVYLYKDKKEIILKENYTQSEYDNFLSMLDFDYIKNLHGTVWLEDGAWLSRCNHNGLEWWNYNKIPDIHNKCLSDKHSIKKDKHTLTIKYNVSDDRNDKRERENS
jgi:hypothetical protein